MKTNKNFTLDKPYFYEHRPLNSESYYDIYCDGSYVEFGYNSFSCIGGLIMSEGEVVAEFYGPLKSDLQLFERQAINVSLAIVRKYKLKNYKLMNDSLGEVKRLGGAIHWCPREENLADQVVRYAKDMWLVEQRAKPLDERLAVFKKGAGEELLVYGCKNKSDKKYYYFVSNEDAEFFESTTSYMPGHFAEAEVLMKYLANNTVTDKTFVVRYDLYHALHRYTLGKTALKEIEVYDQMMALLTAGNHKMRAGDVEEVAKKALRIIKMPSGMSPILTKKPAL